jgi:large repetitive protein
MRNRIILLLWIFCISAGVIFSQAPQTSKDNYTGAWESPASWDPTWAVPQTTMDGYYFPLITINGYITVNGNLTFSGSVSNLIINDTLVILGNLLLDNFNNVTINTNGILIVRGNLIFNNNANVITTNGYFIITGNVLRGGPLNNGSFTSSSDPVKVFVGGVINPADLTQDKPNFSAINCLSPTTVPYPSSNCSYGNSTDLSNDPINTFFQNTCSVINVNSNISVCEGNAINLTSSSGTAYSWSGPNGFTSTVQNPSIPNVSIAMAGDYTITVTVPTGCIDKDTTSVTVNALPVVTAGSNSPVCAGNTIELTSTGGISYNWSGPDGFTSTAQNPSIPNSNLAKSGAYNVIITGANGCTITKTINIVVNSLPATPTITAVGPTTFCAGGSVILTSGAGTSYLWSNGATTSSINVTTAGTYTVRVSNASGCQSAASVATIITVNALPLQPTISANGPITFCAGSSVILTSSAGTSYLWSNGATTPGINVAAAGSYTVRVSNASGCQSTASEATIVTVNALPATPTITAGGPITFCAGGSVTLTSGAGASYLWSNGATTASINVTAAGTYTVRVSNANGCQSAASIGIIVTVNALPATPTITPGGPTTFCAGGSVTLTSSAGTGYLWSNGATTASINVTTAGNYTVSVINANGCQSAASTATIVTVNVLPASPTITADGPTTFCAGGSVTLTSSAGTGYLWSNGATTQSINVTAAGSYTVRVTNANGCQSAASIAAIVIVNSLPATPVISSGGPITFCDGGSVTLTSGAGTSYLWSNGATTSGILVNMSGSYTVIVTNASGCQSAESMPAIITVNDLPAIPTITAGGPTTFCAGSSVTLTSNIGTSYLWSTGATTQSINATIAGSYTVRVSNANGCQSAASTATIITVNLLPVTPTITAGGPITFCTGGSVTLTSSADLNYLWSTGATTQSINATTPGTYTVQVINASGCQSAASIATTVTVNALPVTPTITPGGPTTFCDGGSVTLTSSAGTTYLWSNAATTASINVTTAGSYTVRVTNANGCQSEVSVTTIVTVNSLPATPTITTGGPTTFCAGGSVTLTSSAEANYLWSTGATTQSINATIAGNYTVQVINASGCQSIASVVTIITINALPVTPTITAGGPTDLCAGGEVTLTSSAGSGYLWSNGATTANIVVTTAGSYTVRVTNANECQSAVSSATMVTVNALPATPTITAGGPTTFCDGGSVTLTSSAEANYLWSTGATTASIIVTIAGSYTVRVTNASGCQSAASAATAVTVNSLPATPTITAGGPTSFCAGGSVTLTSSAEAIYLWSTGETTAGINATATESYTVRVTDANGCQSAASAAFVVNVNALPVVNAGTDLTIPNGTSTAINGTVTGTGPFTYSWSPSAQLVDASLEDPTTINLTTSTVFTLTATSTTTLCSNTDEVTITISGVPLSSTPTASPGTVCAGGNVQLNALPAGGSGSYTYTWTSLPAGFTPPIADPIVNPTVNTTYYVTVFDGYNTVNSVVAVTVNALPATPTITAGVPTTFCAGGSVTLTSSAGSGYLWSNWATSPGINATATGSYTVRVTDANGCQSEASAATIVTVNALPATPTITAGGPTTFCEGGSVTLASSAEANYLWSTGETTASIIVSTAGSYTVRVTDGNGCQSAVSVATIVTINTLPATPTIIAGGTTIFCDGGSVTLTSSISSGYLWSTGATTQSINATTAGSYTVIVTNASGCQSAPSVAAIVTVNALPATPTIIADGPTTICAGGNVTLTSSDGVSYLWSNVATAASIYVTTAGSYTVQVTSTNGCLSAVSSAIVVTVNALPSTPTITAGGPTTFCAGGSVTLSSSAGTSYLWSSGETAASINVTTAGSYTVRVSNASGCLSAVSVATIVTINALPATPTITAGGPITLCIGSNVTLTSSAGTNYLWSTGATTTSINVTTAGNYSVMVTSANGCLSAASVATIVTVNALPATPTITAGGPTTFCAGNNVTLTSSSGTSYSWSTGASTASINVNTAGSYSVKVTSVSGCQSAASVATIITVNALPATPTISTNGPTTFCAGGNVQLTSSSGSSYSWSTGETKQKIKVSTSGSYTVRVTNASGCQSVASIATIVTVNALPAIPTITTGGPTTFCAGGSVTLTSSGGTGYSWSNGATTASIVVTTTGNYTVRVRNLSGCLSVASVATIVTVNALPASPVITAGGPTTFCAGGSVTLTSSAEASYQWSTGATTGSITVTTAGSYSVRVTSVSGCQSAVSVATIVTVNALPAMPTITAGGPTTFCEGGSVTLTSSAEANYLWSGGATTASINISTAGSYNVMVTDGNGCQSAVSSATAVTVNALPPAPAISASGPTTFCTGGNVTLTSSAGTGFLWSTGATTASINVSTTGSYTVQVSNTNGCQSAVSPATIVTVNALPATPTITTGGPTTFCAGGSVTLTSSAEANYLWSTGATTQSINAAAAGNYTVQVINASGCQSAVSVTTIVTINALPATPNITADGPTTFCDGDSVTLTSSAGTTYLWSDAAIAPSRNITSAGSYNVQVIDANGCQSAASAVTVVTVNALPATPGIAADGPTTFCDGGSVILTSSAGTGYSWSTGATTASINVTTTGSYTVKVSNTNGCQSAASTATIITVNALPVTPTITYGNPTTFCANDSITLTSSSGAGYLWSNGATTQNVVVNIAGSYSVQVTDAIGCQSATSEAIEVAVNALPVTPTISADGPTTFCAGGSVILTSSAEASYIWSTGATTDSINITTSGSYTVQVTDANGCKSAESAAINVTANVLPATPTITAGSPTTFCDGGSVTLTSSAEANYLWSTGATIQSINAAEAGSYYVQVTDANGCQSTASIVSIVTINALPATPIITAGGPTTFCAGGSVTLTSSSEQNYLWSTGATTQSINADIAGNYTVQVINASGCQSTVSVATIVTINALPITPTITAGGSTTFCSGGSVTLTSSAGTTYLWSDAAIAQSRNITSSGSYTVQVTDASGCQSAASAATLVTVNALPVTPTITAGGPTTFCAGGSVTLTSSAEANYLWSTGATTQSINAAIAGNYTVQLINASGCQSTVSVATIVTINALPITPTITAGGSTAFCEGGSVTLTSSAGTTYLWSDAAIAQSINITTSESYTVQVTDASGCQSAASAATLVTVNALPVTPTITAGGTTTLCPSGSVTLTSSAEANYLWSTGATTASIIVSTAGSYTIRVTNANGCQSAVSAATIVTVNSLPATPTITAEGPTTLCVGDNVTLTSSVGTSYFWSTGAITESINVTLAGSYTVQVTNASGCQSATSAATAITVNVLPIATAGNNGPVFSFMALSLTGGPEGMTTYSWTGPNGFTSNSQSPSVSASALAAMAGVYTLTVTNASGCSDTATTIVEINELPIPSVITPNNDGKNDYFVIGEISGKVDLTIFNRWGNIEYTNSNYLNDWDGRNNKGVELPNDTYFYILKFESGKIIKGSVLIKR